MLRHEHIKNQMYFPGSKGGVFILTAKSFIGLILIHILEIGHLKTFFEFLTLNSKMTHYIFHRTFFGSKDMPTLKMSKIKAVASGYLMLFYFNIHWTPMRSIFDQQALKMNCKVAFGALKYTCQISAFSIKNCRSFVMTPKIKLIFWQKIKTPISAVLPTRIQKYSNTKLLSLRGSHGKNLGWKVRPPTPMGRDLYHLKNNAS